MYVTVCVMYSCITRLLIINGTVHVHPPFMAVRMKFPLLTTPGILRNLV